LQVRVACGLGLEISLLIGNRSIGGVGGPPLGASPYGTDHTGADLAGTDLPSEFLSEGLSAGGEPPSTLEGEGPGEGAAVRFTKLPDEILPDGIPPHWTLPDGTYRTGPNRRQDGIDFSKCERKAQ
jgi:hypothetical protein